MITRKQPLNLMPGYPFEKDYPLEKILFFDIETTGFAAESTYLYLIGCAFYQEGTFHLIQWFSENYKEEDKLLDSFFEFIRDYDVLLHYNGTGFDLPYLTKKCVLLGLAHSFSDITSIDIYKRIYPYKKIFKLRNFKQKSLEDFLNIQREDTFSGGDLIEVYQSYIGKKHIESLRRKRIPDAQQEGPSEADLLLGQLLLHNEDDLKGLLNISPILYYADLFEKPIRILQAGVDNGILSIRFEISALLPVRINYGNDQVYLTAFGNQATVSVSVYEGELKFFYDNYKDYYYLPAEDRVIHKSLAHFVDKDYREKAKPSNCYINKQGIFAPQYEMVITPCFRTSYQDKLSFLEVHTDFLLQEEVLELYVQHLLGYLLK